MSNVGQIPLYQALCDADAMEVEYSDGTAKFVSVPYIHVDDEDVGPFLALEYATVNGDSADFHGFYLTQEQMENAKNVDIGTWLVTGTTEPDFIGEEDSQEQLVIKTMKMNFSNDRHGSRPRDFDPNWKSKIKQEKQ